MYQKELESAKQAALAAGKVIMNLYQKPDLEVHVKGPGQPVTEADIKANDVIRETLLTAFPDDGWLSEEDEDDLKRLQKNRVWIVDPLDDTSAFIHGKPDFTVSIGLVDSGEPVVGVVYNPSTEDLFHAVKNQGAFCNDEPIRLSSPESKLSVLASRSENRRGEWDAYKDVFDVVPQGGAAYKMALVANGKADAFFTLRPKSVWDICAGFVLNVEAGGIVVGAENEKILFNQEGVEVKTLVCSRPESVQKIIEIIHDKS